VLVLPDSAGIWNLRGGEPRQLVPGAGPVHKCGEPGGGQQWQDGAPFTKDTIFCCVLSSLQKVYMLLFLCCGE
jgi:hypothetical protein